MLLRNPMMKALFCLLALTITAFAEPKGPAEADLFLHLKNAFKIVEPPLPIARKENKSNEKGLENRPLILHKLFSNYISYSIPLVRIYKTKELIYPFHSFL